LVEILGILQKIINSSWHNNDGDPVKLARWIRCLFQISLTFDDRVSLQCLDRATEIATKLKEVSNARRLFALVFCSRTTLTFLAPLQQPESYPSDEVEWLAATSFNRAVDFYCASDDVNCRIWAEKSLTLSAVAGVGIGLHQVLTEKYQELRWEE
jgi:hypothetical protein